MTLARHLGSDGGLMLPRGFGFEHVIIKQSFNVCEGEFFVKVTNFIVNHNRAFLFNDLSRLRKPQ